jgi:hypothetical protein
MAFRKRLSILHNCPYIPGKGHSQDQCFSHEESVLLLLRCESDDDDERPKGRAKNPQRKTFFDGKHCELIGDRLVLVVR